MAPSPETTCPRNVYEVIKPFYILSKLVGFSWFRLHGFKWKVEKCLDALLMIVNVSLRLLHVYGSLIMPFATRYSPITHGLRYTFLLINSGLPLVHIVVAFCRRQAQADVFARLHEFDRQISSRFHFVPPHRRHRQLVRIFIATVFVAVPSVVSVTCFVCYSFDLATKGQFTYPVMVSSAVSLVNYAVSFSHIVLATAFVLSRTTCLYSVASATLAAPAVQKVRQLRSLLQLVVEAVDEINKSYAIIGLLCTSVCFVVLISSAFANYAALVEDPTATPFVLINVLWCIFYNAFLVGTVSINGRIKEQVRAAAAGFVAASQ